MRREPAVHALAHRGPERPQARIKLPVGEEDALVRPLHLGDAHAARARHLEHRRRGVEGERELRALVVARLRLRRVGKLLLGHDEAAPDRVVDLVEIRDPAPIDRLEAEAVGVPGEGWAAIEDEVRVRLEREDEAGGRHPRRWRESLPGLEAGKVRLGQLGIEIGGPVAKQTEHDRPIRRVAPAGECEGAVEVDPDPERSPEWRSFPESIREQLEKGAGRRHRPHRVGRGRTDTDLEDVEYAEKHRVREYPWWRLDGDAR